MADRSDPSRSLTTCRRRNRRLRSLVRTAALLNSSLDLGEILRTTLDTATKVMGAEASCVMLIDPEQGDLVYESLYFAGDPVLSEAIGKAAAGYRMSLGEGIAGWVAAEGRALNIPDAYKEPRFNQDMDRQTGFHTRSILAVPLVIHEEVIGVAEVINRQDGRPFDREDVVLFAHFCDLAAVAIEKARLHRDQVEKQALDRELAAAREIQHAFLPSTLPLVDGYCFGRRYRSAQAVGGDFYDLVPGEGGRVGLVVGDVAGKGISAALMGAGVARELRFLMLEGGGPSEISRRANRTVAERSVAGRFVTLLVATVDLETGEGAYVSCGHQPPLLYESASGAARFLEEGTAPPLGVLEDLVSDEHPFRLTGGDRLVLFTDGLSESMSDDGDLFGLERLRLVVQENAEADGTLEGIVARAVEEHAAGSTRHEDDQTYLEVLRLGDRS